MPTHSSDRPPATRAPEPAPTATPPTAPPTAPGASRRPARSLHTRTGAAWMGVVVGALVLVLLIVFMLQNTVPVEVVFFGLRGTAPLAVTLLIAGVGFAVVAVLVGSLRLGQLRRRVAHPLDPDRR